MNLKLAEYNLETGKFERFLDQEDSEYYPPEYQDFKFPTETYFDFNFENSKFLFGKDFIGFRYDLPYEGERLEIFKKDKKDPLNRFEGLFNGRSYGEARFVLVVNDNDNIYKITNNIDSKELVITPARFDIYSYSYTNGYKNDVQWTQHYLGNLHENPELYEKIK